METICNKIFCTDEFAFEDIGRWLGVKVSLIEELCRKSVSDLYAADLGEVLEQITQKDVESCTEKRELEFVSELAVNLSQMLAEDRTKSYASLLYWAADTMAGGSEAYEEALAIAEKSLDIFCEIYGKDDCECAAAYNLVGNLYYVLGKLDQGIEYCEKAIVILKQAGGEAIDNEMAGQLAVFCSDVGVLYLKKKLYQKGHDFIYESEKWLKKVKAEKVLTAATVYYNIGTFFEIMGHSKKALKYFEKTVKIYRKKKMMREFRIASICGLMSLEYGNLEKNIRATRYGEIARTIRERMLGEESLEARQMQSNLGVLYTTRQKIKKGHMLMQKSIKNIAQLDKTEYLDGAFVCIKSATGYLQYGIFGYGKARECLDAGAKLIEESGDQRIQEKEICYENIAARYIDAKEYKKGIHYQSMLIESRKTFFETCDENEKKKVGKVIADDIVTLGQYFEKGEQNARAIQQYEDAIRFCAPLFGEDSDMAGSICLTLSRLYMQIGDVDSSIERGEKAYQIAKRIYGEKSQIAAITKRYLNDVVRLPENVKEEMSMLDKIMEFLFGKKL